MEQIILQGIKPEELFSRFDKIDEQINLLLKLLKSSNSNNTEIQHLSRKEVCSVLKITLPTLNNWTKSGLIPSYRIGSRILYKLEDVHAALDQRKFIKHNLRNNAA